MKLPDIKLNPDNPRLIKDDKFKKLVASIKDFPKMMALRPIVVDDTMTILGGNMRYKALQEAGFTEIPDEWVKQAKDLTEEEKKRFVIEDNMPFGEWDWDLLANNFEIGDLLDWGFNENELKIEREPHGSLTDRFIIPPFTVFDTRQGYWQDRKRLWLALGLDSEMGRGENLLKMDHLPWGDSGMKYGAKTNICNAPPTPGYADIKMQTMAPGTSIFDPVLCEIINTWFNIPKGTVLDPFAGGSVRGIVADKLGHPYTGIDLSKEQIDANNGQAKKLGLTPKWIVGDSNIMIDQLTDKYDLIFSCPPYEDLEKYSDDPADISNMSREDFNKVYSSIIKKSVSHLRDDRFACFVVSEVRNKEGVYTGLPARTIKYFEESGANFYNDIVLYNVAGTLPLRVTKVFMGGRKLGKIHQNVLVFYKGDVKKIKENYGEIDFSNLPSETDEIDFRI